MLKETNTKAITLFLLLTAVFSTVSLTVITLTDNLAFIILYMVSPGVGALFTHWYVSGSIKGFKVALPKIKHLMWGYGLPLLYLLPVYFGVWLYFGNFPNLSYLDELVLHAPMLNNTTALLTIVITGATFGVLGTTLTGALGEELGWRGYLVPKLMSKYTLLQTSLIVGVIWYVWHLPLIFFTGYYTGDDLPFTLSCFFVLVMALSCLFTWLYHTSQSIWPVCIMHASHNVFTQQILTPLTEPTGQTPYIIGDFGVGIALGATLVAGVVMAKVLKPRTLVASEA